MKSSRSVTASQTVEELISQLRSSFFATEFQNVANTLAQREEQLNLKCIELVKKSEAVEDEKELLCLENLKLHDELTKKLKELDEMRKVNSQLNDKVRVLTSEKCSKNLVLENELKKNQSENDAIKKMNLDHERTISDLKSEKCRMEAEIRGYKTRFSELDARVFSLERTSKVLMDANGTFKIKSQNERQNNASPSAAECSKAPRTEPIRADSGVDDQELISTLKTRQVSYGTKKEDKHDDDDDGSMPTGTRKRKSHQVSHNHCTQSNKSPLFGDDDGDSIKRRTFHEIIVIDDDDEDEEEEHISTFSNKNGTQKSKNLDSTCYSEDVKPFLKKLDVQNLKRSLYNSSSDSEQDEEIYTPLKKIIAAMKPGKEAWGSKDDICKELDKDEELCMNAICALYRKRVQWKQMANGIDIPGNDFSRITQLAKLLIDGDPQENLKKTPSEVNPSDLDECREFAKRYSAHLFFIYRKKNDPFFPP